MLAARTCEQQPAVSNFSLFLPRQTPAHTTHIDTYRKQNTFKVKLKSIWIEDEKVAFLKLLAYVFKSVLFFETCRLHSYLPYDPTKRNINTYMY